MIHVAYLLNLLKMRLSLLKPAAQLFFWGLANALALSACGGANSPPVMPAGSSLAAVASSASLAGVSSASSSSTQLLSSSMSSVAAVSSAFSAPADEALVAYKATVEQPVTQAKCVVCHKAGGLSGHTRLVFNAGANQGDSNFLILKNFALTIEGGDALILTKTQGGAAHQGGAVFGSTLAEFIALNHVLNLITGNTNSGQKVSLFEGVANTDPQNTLRRAALIITGSLPSDAALTAVKTEADLKTALRGLMSGAGFHQFLVRAANDRLLTDAFNEGLSLDVLEPNASFYPALASRFVEANQQDKRSEFYQDFYQKLRFGVARAPLELIAHVVENDLPYTQILTANYTMANPQLAAVYNADNTVFGSDDYRLFKPVKNRGQILHNSEFKSEFIEGVGSVITSHGAFVEYPHAGILNEPAFLNRYPTTDTNRNRARSRWAYYHFLGVDIEKSAARTNDPGALADTNNPTLNNVNCTVCHIAMDPVAGAFQNYGNEGVYRDSWGGLDALPAPYKEGGLYQRGDTWYRDMRTPGFGVLAAPSKANSLQWLAQQIINDDRFAQAAIKFWWPAVMAEELLAAPEATDDIDYSEKLAAFDAQNTFINELAAQFKAGINGGAAYNLKDALVGLLMSPWFRAQNATQTLPAQQKTMLVGIGAGRLLTPEELEAKTQALIGYAWGESEAPWRLDNRYSNLMNRYLIYYGGMDSVGITARARALNTLMANVALTQAVSVACGAVVMDFNRTPAPHLFSQVDRYVTPVSQASQTQTVTGTSSALASTQVLAVQLPAGAQHLALNFANPYWDADVKQSTHLIITDVTITNSTGATILSLKGENFTQHAGFSVSQNSGGSATGAPFYDTTLGRSAGFLLWGGGVVLPLQIPSAGRYTVTVKAWRRYVPEQPVFMVLAVNTPEPHSNSAGEQLLRQQLVRLHQMFLGQSLATDSPEIDASYNLLVDTWQWRQENMPQRAYDWQTEGCDLPVANWWQQPWLDAYIADANYMQGTWIAVLIYLMTDYHYLHE